jgi:hypothetical protein
LVNERLFQLFGLYSIKLVKLKILTDLGSCLDNKNVLPFGFTNCVCIVFEGRQLVYGMGDSIAFFHSLKGLIIFIESHGFMDELLLFLFEVVIMRRQIILPLN